MKKGFLSLPCCVERRPVKGETGCGWEAPDTFVCAGCEREVCYCLGCGDELIEFCNDCWALRMDWAG